ncbi:DUF4198 domain-containing protein [Tautonia rosea]|uniref:DUF4198 domain-containing protein n=1 Tax=Tautonia rosea TaxID=2728037 RepID=UPI001473A003|nr:DUF4198 domain-containing protein [Tautonia rosea]
MHARRSLLTLSLFLLISGSAQAHSIAVIANNPATTPGGKVTVFLAWGHRLPVDELVSGNDLEQYQLHSPSGTVVPLKRDDRSFQANEIVLDETGLHQVTVVRAPSVFTMYTEASGKRVHARGPKSELKLPEGAQINLSARSSQFGKALILSGSSESVAACPPLGHALEIVLDSTPGMKGFSLDEPVRARVLFQGKPLAGVNVFAASTSLNPDGSPELSAVTDEEGRVALDLFEPGTWVLQASHRAEAPEDQRDSYDTESFLASFTIPVAADE